VQDSYRKRSLLARTFTSDGLRVDAVLRLILSRYSRKKANGFQPLRGAREHRGDRVLLRLSTRSGSVATRDYGLRKESTAARRDDARRKWRPGFFTSGPWDDARHVVSRLTHPGIGKASSRSDTRLLYAFSDESSARCPTTSRARERLSLRTYAGRRARQGRDAARFFRPWDAPGKNPLHGGEIGQPANGITTGEINWALLQDPRMRRSEADRRSEPSLSRRTVATRARCRAGGV